MYQLNIGKAFPLVLLFSLTGFLFLFFFWQFFYQHITDFCGDNLCPNLVCGACGALYRCGTGADDSGGQDAGDSRKGIQTPETKRRYEQIE